MVICMAAESLISELIFTGIEPALNFRVVEAKIVERLDYPYEIDCICYYEGVKNLPYEYGLDTLTDNNIRLYLQDPSYTNNKERANQSRLFKGVTSQVIYLGNKELQTNISLNHKYYYRFKLNSQLIRLSYNNCFRIYNNKSVLEVLKHIFERSKGPVTMPVDFSRVQNSFKQEEYICQYNESDLDFLLRLCSRYGIYIAENSESINFYDSVYQTDFTDKDNTYNTAEAVKHVIYPYNPASDNYLSSHCISSIEQGLSGRSLWTIFSTSDASVPGSHKVSKSQNYWEERAVDNRDKNTVYAENINFYHPSYTNTNYQNGMQFQSSLNSLANHVSAVQIKAKSNILELNTNDVLTITNLEGGENTYKVIGIVHYYHDKSEQGGRILEQEPALYSMYSNELYLIPNTMPYASKVINKPRAYGITSGIVIGKSDNIESERNTILVDEYGRVRVQFASYAVQGKYDEETFGDTYKHTHSCYLRYASPAASHNSGFIAVPRVGDEVVVSFIDGDPDRPIITGSLYTPYNPSLIHSEILASKHKTSLSSKTVGKGEQGRNELTMSNLPGSEQIYLKAEKDYEELVQNNYDQTILNNKTSNVSGTHTESILQAHIQNIAGLKDVNVGGEYLTVVALSKDTAVGLSNTLNVGAENTLRVAGDSKEFISGDKIVEIEGDIHENYLGECIKTVSRNVEETVQGSIDQTCTGGINISTESHYDVTCEQDMDLYSKLNITITSDEHTSLVSDSMNMEINTSGDIDAQEFNINAQSAFTINIGDNASITSDGSSMTLKISDVELLLDGEGLTLNKGKFNIKK